MTAPRDPLAAFDRETIERTAAADLPADDLARLVARHQESVRNLPGVEDIVYEWRNHFQGDPLVHRTPDVYVLALPARVWEEFADALGLEGAELEALRSVHDRQARAHADEESRFDGAAAMVLTRP